MDLTLLGTLLLGVAFAPCVVEVFLQLRLQARFLEALPDPARRALPPHPRRPSLAFLGSPRFQLAYWRTIRRDLPEDPDPVAALKRRMRSSLRREAWWGASTFALLVLLLASGWRPLWP